MAERRYLFCLFRVFLGLNNYKKNHKKNERTMKVKITVFLFVGMALLWFGCGKEDASNKSKTSADSTRQTAKKNRGQINELKINVVQLQEKINYFVTKVDDFISHSNTHTNEIIKSIDSIKPNTFKTNMTYSVMVFIGMTVGTIIIQMIINNLV